MNPDVKEIGVIYGIKIYFDEYHPKDKVMYGRNGKEDVNFILGGSDDLNFYKKIIENLKSNHLTKERREYKINEILDERNNENFS